MKIDLHVHCRKRSVCSVAGENDLIQQAINTGLDSIAFTDHDRLVPAAHLAELNQRFAPFRIFGGIEITLSEEHILVYGIQDLALQSRAWNYADLWHFARQKGGVMVLAHPFRFQNYIGAAIDRYPPDAIEIHSHNTSIRYEGRIRTIAEQLGIRLLSNSDAHAAASLGHYFNQVEVSPANDLQLVQILKNETIYTFP